MGDLVNLRQARKRAARRKAEQTASENRALHGASKVERIALRADRQRDERHLDGARIERPREDDAPIR